MKFTLTKTYLAKESIQQVHFFPSFERKNMFVTDEIEMEHLSPFSKPKYKYYP